MQIVCKSNKKGFQQICWNPCQSCAPPVGLEPVSKFQELCSHEDWSNAFGIADSMNKEILSETTLYQSFVKNVKQLPDYISISRSGKLNQLDLNF